MKDKPLFIQRFVAFILDTFIVAMAASLIATPFTDSKSLTVLEKELSEVANKYVAQEITAEDYLEEYSSLYYKITRTNGLYSLLSLFFGLLYFVVYQFYHGGQTIGKKLMKIKVVSQDGELEINQMAIRSLIANSILINMLLMACLVFMKKSVYLSCAFPLLGIEAIIILVSTFMVLFRKDGFALHDIFTKTKVIKVKTL